VPALLLLAAIVAVVSALNAPAQRFLPSFVRLLDDAAVHAGLGSFFSGRSVASGTFGGRDVVILLKLKRGRYDHGYLIASMRTRERAVLDSAGVDARGMGEAARRALFALATHDLRLSVEDGWLKALWEPQGFLLFPGTFHESNWREVLGAMEVVAASLDAAVGVDVA
jgi:hypothetical protein